MSRIGFIGTGHIAAPMVRFLARKGHQITVTERNAQVSAALAREVGVHVADAQGVLDAADIVFLCLRPPVAESVLAPLTFRPDHRIVSVMASNPEPLLRTLCAPATDLVQTVPLGFVEAGGCPLAAYGNDRLLAELFGPENPVIKVGSESALNAHFAICAMVPGLLDLMATGAGWLGDKTGDPTGAEVFTTQLVAGFLAAMDKGRAGRLAEERDALGTEGTLSLQMVETLRREGAHDALRTALKSIEKRLEE
ncbi:NAD(P)-binding domain-containing protein [Tropicimonas isoalkanivorans]|uniref:Pyrroline-5-carboxylate reductase n=1 Tax=Tropicimonas isoalkanivorans TaxID=441112 RepID=A0A1I1EFA0_9RHOB|nr:NAD(P)-binding domain-containing protein [Tropicimonas isoalkanivorans]SFB83998.1 pyrroline-5-carboxylate reductase [Tropicimonas isoalkanivorans]